MKMRGVFAAMALLSAGFSGGAVTGLDPTQSRDRAMPTPQSSAYSSRRSTRVLLGRRRPAWFYKKRKVKRR